MLSILIVYLKLILSREKGDTFKYKSSPFLFTLQLQCPL